MNPALGPETGPDGASKTQMSPATAGRADDIPIAIKSRDPRLRSRPSARIDGPARVRRRPATHRFLPAAAIGPPRSTCHRIGVALLDERVHTSEQHGKQGCHDRPPQCEHEQAETPAQATAHRLYRGPGLNDR